MKKEKELISECAKQVVEGLIKDSPDSKFSFLSKDEFLARRVLMHDDGETLIYTDKKTLFYITSLIDLVVNMDNDEEG